jgi:hypothetical protein
VPSGHEFTPAIPDILTGKDGEINTVDRSLPAVVFDRQPGNDQQLIACEAADLPSCNNPGPRTITNGKTVVAATGIKALIHGLGLE